MRHQVEKRLRELRAEFEAGHRMLAEAEAKQRELQSTLLRIAGAIQVLGEELAKADAATAGEAPDTGPRLFTEPASQRDG